MKGYRISILRHGLTEANEEGIYIGRTDFPLSENGIEELVYKYETREYPKVQRVYSSPLKRALQSAAILFPDRETVISDEMSEMDFGVFEGLSAASLLEFDSYKKWLKGGTDNPPPNGESLREMIARCYGGLNLIILNMMKEGITHAGLVTHSGIMMNLLSCFGVPKRKPMEYACGPGEGYEVITTAMMWQNGGVFEVLGKIPC